MARGRLGLWGVAVTIVLMLTACVGPQSVAPAPQKPPAAAPPALPLETIRYTIQVGAFSTPERAAAYEERLAADGVDAYYFIDTDQLSKVRFGRFDSKAAAQKYAGGLVARGVIDDFYIVRPRSTGTDSASHTILRKNLIATARRFIGTPYQWGGASASVGFDCSGLTMTVYRLNGLELPRTARAQYRAGSAVEKETLQAGDLVFFRTGSYGRISHVGIYSGGGRFIHAPGSGKTIRSAFLDNDYFKSRFAGACRYF